MGIVLLIMHVFDELIEARIQEARQWGDFNNPALQQEYYDRVITRLAGS